jgi:hypothetical protein
MSRGKNLTGRHSTGVIPVSLIRLELTDLEDEIKKLR